MAPEDEAPPTVWVAAPRRLLETKGISGTEAAVYVALATHRSYKDAHLEVFPSRARLMTLIGRPGHQPGVVSRATTRLQELGLLEKRFGRLEKRLGHRVSRTCVMYRLPGLPKEAYVELPAPLLGWLDPQRPEGRRLTSELLLAWMRWLDACGEERWTDDSVADFAHRYGDAPRNVKRHRLLLARRGLLVVQPRPGQPSITRVPDREALDALLGEPLTV